MVLRDPFAAQRLIDQGEEDAAITEMLGPRPTTKAYQPPGPGMIPGNPSKPFRFADNPMPSAGTDPKAAINARFANTGDPFEDRRQRRITDLADQGQHQEGAQFVEVGPAKRLGMGRQDAMALAALDPRALDEANKLAELDAATPAPMYAKVGGREFHGVPGQRVDRNALARLYANAQERKAQERQDSVRSQEQGGRERLVAIPGEQATRRREMELGAEERITGKKLEADAPMRAADVAAKGAQTAAVAGAESRAQATAARQPDQEKIAALERLLEARRASPFAATAAGRNDIAAAEKLLASMSKVDLPPATTPGTDGNFDDYAALLNDPNVVKMAEQLKAAKQGVFYSADRAAKGNAAAKALRSYVTRYAQAKGIDPDEALIQIQSLYQ